MLTTLNYVAQLSSSTDCLQHELLHNNFVFYVSYIPLEERCLLHVQIFIAFLFQAES